MTNFKKWSPKRYRMGLKGCLPNVPELNKWQAHDFLDVIGKKWLHEINSKDSDVDVEFLTDTLIAVHQGIWNKGMTGITEETPLEEREKAYWKKLWVSFWINSKHDFKATRIDHKRYYYEYNEQIDLSTEDDSDLYHQVYDSILLETIFEWVREHCTKLTYDRLCSEYTGINRNTYTRSTWYYNLLTIRKEIKKHWKEIETIINKKMEKLGFF